MEGQEIFNSYKDIDPKVELDSINEQIKELNQLADAEWTQESRELMAFLQTKARNLEETLQRINNDSK